MRQNMFAIAIDEMARPTWNTRQALRVFRNPQGDMA